MPEPYVTSVTITGNQLTFDVQIDDFEPNTVIEVVGQATQSGGAFAPISEIKTVLKGESYVEVTAINMGDSPFKRDQDITVFVRVSRVWVTVLGPQGKEPAVDGQDAPDGMTWSQIRKTAELKDKNSSTQGGKSQQQADGTTSAA